LGDKIESFDRGAGRIECLLPVLFRRPLYGDQRLKDKIEFWQDLGFVDKRIAPADILDLSFIDQHIK
jgi:hypothetical protein